MAISSIFPLPSATEAPQLKPEAIDTLQSIGPRSVFRPKAFALASHGGKSSLLSLYTNKSRANFEEPEFDFSEILAAIDTDSLLKMGFSKYRELFWKEGWDIVGENQEAIDYLWERIDLFEEVMKRPFTDFLSEAVDQMIKFANAFIVITRGNIRPLFRGRLYTEEGQDPISGFYIIPTETVRIYRNRHNEPIAYKQALDETAVHSKNTREPRWSADEVIHLSIDKKPGRAFGTPFVVDVLDDVISLRTIEQDILTMIHKELFPLYVVTVGTEDKPAQPNEVEEAAAGLNDLRTEGGLVLPDRHTIDVLGAANHALDAREYLKAFTVRVITGLGLSPHHLGMMMEGGNRSVTDTLDKALYDRIKMYQQYIEDQIRLHIFNPLLREGGFDPSVPPTKSGQSDRCYFRFREIDIDSEVKVGTYYLNLFAGNAITLEELRLKLGMDPQIDPNQLFMVMQHFLSKDLAITAAGMKPAPASGSSSSGSAPKSVRPNTQPSSTGILPNLPNARRGPGNSTQPANQHGRRMSPNIRRIDDSRLQDIVEILGEDIDE